jgi:hypothetical protein
MANMTSISRKISIIMFVGLLFGLVFSFSSVRAEESVQPERKFDNWTSNGYKEYTVLYNESFLSTSPAVSKELMSTSNAGCAVSNTDLIAHWPLDDGQGATTFADVFGGHDGSCTGETCPVSIDGKVGGAFAFTSSESDSIEVLSSTAFDWLNADSFSVGVWVKTSQNCEGNKVFVGRYRDSTANPTHGNWWVGCKPIDEGDPENEVGVAVFRLRTAGNLNRQVNGTSQINDGEWHHIVGVRDGSNDKNYLYLDGKLEGTLDTPDYLGGDFVSDQVITMGSYEENATYLYDGVLDEVVIHKRALPESEIKQYFDACIVLSPNIYLPLVMK